MRPQHVPNPAPLRQPVLRRPVLKPVHPRRVRNRVNRPPVRKAVQLPKPGLLRHGPKLVLRSHTLKPARPRRTRSLVLLRRSALKPTLKAALRLVRLRNPAPQASLRLIRVQQANRRELLTPSRTRLPRAALNPIRLPSLPRIRLPSLPLILRASLRKNRNPGAKSLNSTQLSSPQPICQEAHLSGWACWRAISSPLPATSPPRLGSIRCRFFRRLDLGHERAVFGGHIGLRRIERDFH